MVQILKAVCSQAYKGELFENWFRYNNVWENLKDYFRYCKYGRTSTLTDNQIKKKKLKYTKWSLPFHWNSGLQ